MHLLDADLSARSNPDLNWSVSQPIEENWTSNQKRSKSAEREQIFEKFEESERLLANSMK